jgi:hypothetical protein
MSPPKTAPYGSWLSPITSDLIVAQSIALAEVRLDGDHVYWLEGRPQEQGRMVVVRTDWAGGHAIDMTPKPFSARTRVHEYGGGAWTVARGVVYFSNFSNGRLYRVSEAAPEPQALTPSPPAPESQWRYADGIIDHVRRRWIGVREDHTAAGEAVNTIVAVALEAAEPQAGLVLIEGHDFFAAPRLSPDGRHLVWLAWDHPNMPWNGTTLYLAALDPAGGWRRRKRSRAGLRNRSSSPNGRPTAARSTSYPIAATGGTCTASISPPAARNRSCRWRRNSACRNGISPCRPMPASAATGSFAPIFPPA